MMNGVEITPIRKRTLDAILGIGLLVFLCSTAGTAQAAIANPSPWAQQYFGVAYPAGPVNATYTIAAGSGRVLVVAIASTATTAVAQTVSVTYGGQALTLAAGDGGSTATWNHSYLYYLNDAGIAAASGTSLNVTITGGTRYYTWVYAAVFAGVDQTTPFTDAKNYNSAAGGTAVGPFSPTLTINAGDQAIEIVNLARSATGGTERQITTWATGWTTAGVAPGRITTNGPTATMYIRNRNVLTAANDGSQHTADSANTWDSMTAGSLKAGPTTTLGNGVAGTTATVCPGATAQKLDGFSFVNSSGANPVTALTVTTTNQAAIASMQIWDDAGTTQYFGTVNNPGSNTWSFSGGTSIPVSTTIANFKIVVTYDPYATAPVGNTATTAQVTAFTTVNATAGTDTADTTLTLDHAAPAAPTTPTCTGASPSQINLTWTNAGNNSLVVRGPAGGAAPTFVPAGGTIYTTGAQGSDFIVAAGAVTTASDNTGLTAGTTYAYRIYAYDACTNYSSTALSTSCATQTSTTTIGNGAAEPGPASICPGGAATMVDAFSLQTAAGIDTIASVTVTLATGTWVGVSLVEITNVAGTAVYGSAAPAADTVAITTIGLTATTTLTEYRIRVTPDSATAMPAPPGATYVVTARVTAVSSPNVKVYNDSGSSTLTIDNLSPGNPTALAGVPCNAQVALSWTNPADLDFSQIVVLRSTAAIVAVPVEGTTYTAGNTIGASTVIYVGAGTSFTDTGLTNGTSYYYKVFAKDLCGNYSSGGTAAGPYTPSATTADLSITKTASAPTIINGQNVTYTITVHNGGPSNATGVIVTDTLPVELTYVSATPSQGGPCSYSAPTVTCNLGGVSYGANATISLIATATAAGLPWNAASVTANEVDCNPSNNSTGVLITVPTQVADLVITKSGPASTTVGGAVSYTIWVTNNGPATANAVTVTDPIPAGMTLVSAGTIWPGGSCTGNPIVTCSLGNMVYTATASITINVTNNTAGTKSNTATVSSSPETDFDPNTMNNNATTTTTVTGAAAPLCATPGKDGSPGTVSGVVNTYYPGTANVNAGLANTCIAVGTSVGAATAVAAGDLLLVIQMQDAVINYTNTNLYGDGTGIGAGATAVAAGKYEFVKALGIVGFAPCAAGQIPITGAGINSGLLNGYTNANATATKGQMRFQVVRVPQYVAVTANGITASPWTTNTAAPIGLGTGGIVAIDVQGTLTLSTGAAIVADGLGFRGGAGRQLTGGAGANTDWVTLSTITTNGSKGEGIAGTPEWVQGSAPLQTNQPNDGYPNGSMARGAPANAGGGSTDGNPAANDQNSGGGGGSNGGAGGKGGFSWSSQLDTGGTGAAITPALTKLVLGGGGGGGTRNNNPGDNLASGGAAGGGLVLVRAGQLSVSAGAVISANGLPPYEGTLNDGGGGGGAGGSIAVLVNSGTLSGLTILARGSAGSSTWIANAPGTLQPPMNVGINAHGPGGGGGGGVVAYTNTATPPTIDVAGGVNGTTTTALYQYGAQPGSTGQVLYAGPGMIQGLGSGSDCATDPGVTLTHSLATVNLGDTVTVIATVTNYAPYISTSGTITVVITLDPTSPGLTTTLAGVSASGWSCAVAAGGQVVTCSRSNALAAQISYPVISITATVGATGTAPTTLTNTASLTPTPTNDANLANNVATDDVGVLAPTLARLRSFHATRFPGAVLLSWKTGFEVDNLGFVVYRESGGVRQRITPSMVAGSALFVGPRNRLASGRSYTWVDRDAGDAPDVRYWLEDVDLNGTRRLTGPAIPSAGAATVSAADGLLPSATLSTLGQQDRTAAAPATSPGLGVERMFTPAARSIQPGSAAKTASGVIGLDASSGINIWSGASQPGAKILVRQEGWYHVVKTDLIAAGFDPGTDSSRLQLFAEGVEQPILVLDGSDGKFGATNSIEFYGTGLNSSYTDARVYWLLSGNQKGLRISQASAQGGPSSSQPKNFLYTVQREDHTVFFATATSTSDTDNIVAAILTSDPVTQELDVSNLDSSASGNVTLTVAVEGVTTDSPHVVNVVLNGHPSGTVSFAAQKTVTRTFTVPVAWVQAGSNVVTLTATGGGDDVSALISVSLTYPHLFVLDQGALRFTLPDRSQITLGGLTDSSLRVVDITDPTNVDELSVGGSTRPGSGFPGTVTNSSHNTATLLAFTAARVLAPAGIVANAPSTWSSKKNSADLVIIAHPTVIGAVPPLATLRKKQGYATSVIDVTDLYDEFNFGEKSPHAIRDFLSFASQSWAKAPHYVLLVGDASFDPKNYLGMGDLDLVPTMMIPTAYMVTDSDDWFVDFAGKGLPGIAVGRLSVSSADEATTVVSKILSHDQVGGASGAWSKSVLLVADANDEFNFEDATAKLQPLVTTGLSVQKVLAGQVGPAAARSSIVSAINAGQLLVNYTGHGSEDVWSKSDIFEGSDVPILTNGSKLPFFVIMTCLNGLFNDIYTQSLAEDLQKAPGGGAVAVWASSALTEPVAQAQMNQALFQLLFNNPSMTVGDAVIKAKAAVTDLDVRRSWILFGDPTMKLRPSP